MSIVISSVDFNSQQDGEQFLFLLNAYANDEMGGGEPLSDYSQQHLISAIQKRHDVFSFILRVDNQLAGLINLVEGFSTFKAKPVMNIHDVVILESFRGKGLVQFLLKQAETFAKQRGCCKLTLEVLEGNEVAKRAYLKFGFKGYELDPKMGSAQFWEKSF